MLVDTKTKQPVSLPYQTTDFRGDPITVVGFTAPRHAGSTGRIQTKEGNEYFPGVANLKIVE